MLKLSRATQNLCKWNPAFAIHVADKVGLRLYSKSEYKAVHGPIPWLDQLFTYAYQTAHQSRQRQLAKRQTSITAWPISSLRVSSIVQLHRCLLRLRISYSDC